MGDTRRDDTGFAERLKSLRAEAGLTLGQLAERAGMHLYGIAKLEAGQREPSWSTVLKLAAALGVDSLAFQTPPAAPAKAQRRGRPKKATPAKRANRKGDRHGR